jgi:hypothetical protein
MMKYGLFQRNKPMTSCFSGRFTKAVRAWAIRQMRFWTI